MITANFRRFVERTGGPDSLMSVGPREAMPTARPGTPEAITQAEWSRVRAKALPLINQMATPDNDLVEAADKEGAALLGRTQQQIEQVNGRRIGTMSAAQRRHINNTLMSGSTATSATNSTAARLAQRDFNNEKAVTAYNYANAITNQGLSTLTQGNNMKMQREAQNKANSKSFMSSMLGMVGTVAGGMMGGPVGAAIGGAVGSGIGG